MSELVVKFCIRCGSPVNVEPLYGADRPVCPACGWIYFADPKVAAAAYLERDGQVLLVRRINEPERGRWSLPAGFVNPEEDPARAAERECLEETGLAVHATHLLGIIPGREHPHGADMVIVYRVAAGDGELQPGDDADQAAFFPIAALPPLAFRATVKAIRLGAASS